VSTGVLCCRNPLLVSQENKNESANPVPIPSCGRNFVKPHATSFTLFGIFGTEFSQKTNNILDKAGRIIYIRQICNYIDLFGLFDWLGGLVR
jgi:hypothetical protein